jgi:hypothetical protein
MIKLLALALAAVLAGCCSAQQFFQASVVSMTKMNMSSYKRGDTVTGQYCTGDDPVATNGDDMEIGLMDQAILKAQKKAKADGLADVSFFRECNCVNVKGTAIFAKGGGGGGGGKKHKKGKSKKHASLLEEALDQDDDDDAEEYSF